MLNHDPAAKTHDRIGFTMSMAVAFHAAVILGVGFMIDLPFAPSATRMDITLSHYQSDQEVLDADYVAQTNQEASGSISDKKELTTTEIAPINSSQINKIQTQSAAPKQQTEAQQLLLVTSDSGQKNVLSNKQLQQQKAKLLQGELEALQRQLEMTSLQAKLENEQQTYARIPKVRQAQSVATKASVDAQYLYQWQQRIETIGNEHYPELARKGKLFGNVQVRVRIEASGKLQSVEVLESSGHKVLDDAAMQIVRLSSPFKPFTPQMKENTDILEIIRTWEFQKNRFSKYEQ